MPSEEEYLIHVAPSEPVKAKTYERLQSPIWTENKAKLIERYLYYFIWVTRHGTYIDAFAGPQRVSRKDMWAAKLVIENEPRWLRNFYLFESDPKKVDMLRQVRAEQAKVDKNQERTIKIFRGDCNVKLPKLLHDYPIKSSEATFCLLDQRTFECDWDTVVTLAHHKDDGYKIELFYFLASSWLHRGASKRKANKMSRWFGNAGWEKFLNLNQFERAETFRRRFTDELKYQYASAFPIHGKHNRRTMYWMIHATDHPAAPRLMYQAYRCALKTKETSEQLELLRKVVE
jgi:three-Cys-motif partner protein